MTPELKAVVQVHTELAKMSNQASSTFEVPNLKPGNELLPFQRAGVEFIEKALGMNGTIQGVLVGDSMGLGKTIQSIGYMALHSEKRPVLVVCPASLKLNWQREIKKWLATKETISIITGTGNQFAQVFGASVVIINYDILGKWIDILTKCNFQLMIVDECHLCKNPKAIRSAAVKAMSKVIPQAIYLSGTPIVNRPVELFPVLNMIDPASWPKFTSYAYRYCEAGNNGWGWSANGASNLEELHGLIKPFVIRRTKEQVLTELPPKRKATIVMQFDEKQRQAYWDALQAVMSSSKPAEQLRLIEASKQAAVKGKLPAAIDWIDNFIETEKLVVFCTHNFTVDALMAKFGDKAVRLTGSENLKEREIAVDSFQNDNNIRLFVGNVIAAGTGITLTAASNVAFLEYPWQPGAVSQSSDRVHRIGQTDSVTIWFLIADDTIEEKIVELLNSKAEVLDIVHDGAVFEEHQISIMGELMTEIKAKFQKETK
jgi:SWI/SNF-related matrix-associated actin-dependent regulator of chromatin subfamily A-like protein 1